MKCDYKAFWKSALNIVIPLVIFHLVSVICLVVYSQPIGMDMLITPYWTLWYLLSLFFWRLILQYSPARLIKSPVMYIFVAVVLSLLSGLIPHGRCLSITRTLSYYPFFLIGYYMKNGILPSKLRPRSVVLIVFGTLLCLLAYLGVYPEKMDLLLRGADRYGVDLIPAKLCILGISYIMSMFVFNLIKEQKILSLIGKDSLLYYLYHGLIIKFILVPLVLFCNLPLSIPFLLLYAACCIVFIWLLVRLRLFRWFANPLVKRTN